MSGRKVDHVQLAYFADQLAPRALFWSDGPRPTATITLSVFFHATDEEINAVGDDYILVGGPAQEVSDRPLAYEQSCGAVRVRSW